MQLLQNVAVRSDNFGIAHPFRAVKMMVTLMLMTRTLVMLMMMLMGLLGWMMPPKSNLECAMQICYRCRRCFCCLFCTHTTKSMECHTTRRSREKKEEKWYDEQF